MKITRRRLAAAALGQTALLAQAPQPPLPATMEQELAAVREQNQRNAEALAKVKLPMQAEPAFVFKA